MRKLYKNRYKIDSTRLKGWNYSAPGMYFVTICTNKFICHFGEVVNEKIKISTIGKIIDEEWQKTEYIRVNVELDEYIVMPNHIHGIITIVETPQTALKNSNEETFQRNVSNSNAKQYVEEETFQRNVSTTNRNTGLKPNTLGSILGQFKSVCTKRIWAMGYPDFAWQNRYHDHIIRHEKSLNRIREYIIMNPLKWELNKGNPEIENIEFNKILGRRDVPQECLKHRR